MYCCTSSATFSPLKAFGINTPDVTLLPIGGVARLERIPEEPGREFWIAIAGPLVNVAITLLLVGFAGADLSAERLAKIDNAQISMVDRLAAVNVFLAAFNLLPAFPMDGGRVLRSLLALRIGFGRATQVSATIGQGLAFALGFVGLFVNPMLIFIAIFVYLAAASEAQIVALQEMSRGVPVASAMMTQYATLSPETQIDEAVETLLRTSQSDFPVVRSDGKLAGILSRIDIIRALKNTGTGRNRRRSDDYRDSDVGPLPNA